MMHHIFIVALFATITFALSACTTTDPYTGEQVVDEDATAALIGGLAVGAVALHAASSDDDDDRHEYHHYYRDYDRDDYYSRRNSHSPRNGVTCHGLYPHLLQKTVTFPKNGPAEPMVGVTKNY